MNSCLLKCKKFAVRRPETYSLVCSWKNSSVGIDVFHSIRGTKSHRSPGWKLWRLILVNKTL